MKHDFLSAGWLAAAAMALFALAFPPGEAAAAPSRVPSATAQAKHKAGQLRELLAAMQRRQVYFVSDKAIRPSTCAVTRPDTHASASTSGPRAKKSKVRSGVQWGLQRAARRGGKQSAGTTAKADAPEVLEQLRLVMREFRRGATKDAGSGRRGSLAGMRALAHIEANPGLQVGSLARELGIHQSTASNLLERLAREGMVTKRRAADDQRSVSLYATARGRSALKSAQPAQDRLREALARLPASSLATLNAHLKGLVAALRPDRVGEA
jgi:DNA-binding MarR family transcriptional regulator